MDRHIFHFQAIISLDTVSETVHLPTLRDGVWQRDLALYYP